MTKTQHVHFIGIGGSGLSAIARLLLESGYTVSGSDRTLSPLAQELAKAGARVFNGHSAENIQQPDVVVRSSAVPDDNVEVEAALAAGIPVLKRSEFLGKLMEGKLVIAVAGTHGKTTTTAMIAWLFHRLDEDPSYIIGGTAKNLGSKNAHAGKGHAFIIEADEYDRMFLGLNPDVIVVTTLEHDHPDCYPTPQSYQEAFEAFVGRLKPGGLLLVSRDQEDTHRLASAAPSGAIALTYGMHPQADYSAKNVHPNTKGGFTYKAVHNGETLARVVMQAPGEHNVRNSLAALAVASEVLALDPLDEAALILGEFSGTGRRFDIQGEVDGITIIDDYAHHPTEIQATLAAARARYNDRRIWAVWQPHTYSRTRSLMDTFSTSFADADRVIVTEVYSAREKALDFDNFSAAQVVERMSHPGVQFIPALPSVTEHLLQNLQPGDVLLVLSAGDADQISAQVLANLRERTKKDA